jgi:two-component system, NtrC family, sensor kinase
VLTRFNQFVGASIGRRLSVGMCLTLLTGLAISIIFSVRDEHREMVHILYEKGKSALRFTAPHLGRSLEANDPQALQTELVLLLQDPDFDYVYVFDDSQTLAKAADLGITAEPLGAMPRLATLRQGRFVPRTSTEYLEILTPIIVDGRKIAAVGLGLSLDMPMHQGRRIGRRLMVVAAGLLVLVLALIYWWTRKTVAPLVELTKGAEEFSKGNLVVRVPVSSRDEVGRLAATFNQLAESLQRTLEEKDRVLAETNRLYRNLKVARARLGRAERLSAVGMLAAGVSHELNNPLGIILSTAGNLREAAGESSPFAEDIAIIEGETERCRRIIQGLLNFAASGESHPEEVDLNTLMRETVALAKHDKRVQHLSAEWHLDPQLPLLWVDPRQMQQVFLNLLINAADAMDGRGVVGLRTSESIEGGNRRILIEFADHGCGISPADLDHIFDPFYTTKRGGAGFGLGLAVSYGIIASHGGEITVTSELGHGSVFTITLPVHSEASQLGAAGQVR